MQHTTMGRRTRRTGQAFAFAAVLAAGSIVSVASAARTIANSPDGLWSLLDEVPAAAQPGTPFVRPPVFKPLTLNYAGMKQLLATAPMEFTAGARSNPLVLDLPMPDGTFAKFRIVETVTMEEPLRAKFPQIRSYSGIGINDRTASVRLDVSEHGFRAAIWSEQGMMFIDPYTLGNTDVYTAYRKRDLGPAAPFSCGVANNDRAPANVAIDPLESDNFGTQVRNYRFAMNVAAEFTAQAGGTVAGGLSAANNIINRMSLSYERDLAVRFTMVANNDLIIYTNAATDPFTNPNVTTMLTQSISNSNAVIGAANYDVGHVLGWGAANGVAGLSVICTASKARGCTIADAAQTIFLPFSIDYVAHEVGHQFSGNHTFNNCGGSNAGTGNATVEPGSAVTIMGYAGICGSTNIAPNSIDTFHNYNILNEMRPFTTTGSGGTCGTLINTGNNIPTVNAGPDEIIPVRTPLVMTAVGSDPDGDALTYQWEQRDPRGVATALQTDPGSGPIFRSFDPTSSPTRYFLRLPTVFGGSIISLGETLPTTARTITLSVAARDGRGGYFSDFVLLTTNINSGPFTVSSQNTPTNWLGNSAQTVTWNVANTNNPPVSCANVRIAYTADGGNTWVDIIPSTPNDGSESITVPNVNATGARIGVFAVDNVFFNVNLGNIAITAVTVACAADCDGSGSLSPADFTCFLAKYRAGDSSADCDASGTFSPADFTCFLAKYRAGCP